MTNQTHEVEVKETKPKRRSFPKNQATVADIIKNFNDLKAAVSELEEAIEHVEEGSTVHAVVSKELFAKTKELEDVLDTVYYY